MTGGGGVDWRSLYHLARRKERRNMAKEKGEVHTNGRSPTRVQEGCVVVFKCFQQETRSKEKNIKRGKRKINETLYTEKKEKNKPKKETSLFRFKQDNIINGE